ncbi:MAG: lipopolysaccharide biosynthesis protein, partial [Muribaculaceae bacterium]|nr:lipopolysaccharide biosynthesis protein [Muribaculaceae bacterium]
GAMLHDLLPFLFITLVVMGTTWVVTSPLTNLYALLVARIIIATALYALIMKLLHATIFEECVEFIKSRIKK